MKVVVSRRSTLKLLSLLPAFSLNPMAPLPTSTPAPTPGASPDFLTATLTWDYPNRLVDGSMEPYRGVKLKISSKEDMGAPIVDVSLLEDVTSIRLAVLPDTTYYWRLIPFDENHDAMDRLSKGTFRTQRLSITDTEDDSVRYQNPRVGAHWIVDQGKRLVPFATAEPLSPWYSQKSYLELPPPPFKDLMPLLPRPVIGNGEQFLDAYWYCWKTQLEMWCFAPSAPDHQAVANLQGIRTWGVWGSTMVWDSSFMLHFCRYGHRAYPFIKAFDNCYARQHDNGFICREADSNNREVYSGFPLNPPLFAWAEWEYYQLSADTERLRHVLLPIVKHYEWWMKYQRRANGLYWTDGFNEADDSPRNVLMYYAASASSYQALAALYLAKIAREVGRPDLVDFFTGQHASLGKMVNEHFWDAKHAIYNDLTRDGRFITELEPGVLCKHCHIFWPMLAQIADTKGINGLVAELQNPNSFDRHSGVPSLSADSKGYREDGQYWKGSVWPPIQCMVEQGLVASGKWELANEIAQRYLRAVLEAYGAEHTITENLAPDSSKGYGAKNFVGWGGIGPVSNLIEFVLGFTVNAPAKTIEWRITRTDRHGIENLAVGSFTVSLICAARQDASSPCQIAVESDSDFSLKVYSQGRITTYPVKSGKAQITAS